MGGHVVAIGASHAGVQFVAALRELGHDGPITLIGEEVAWPYQRPPLSKAFMAGSTAPDNMALRGPDFFDMSGIVTRLGIAVRAIDRARQQVVLSDGETVDYDALLLATGTRPRPWPGGPMPEGVFALRSLGDAACLRTAAEHASGPVVIVGGGYIGLELAATLRGKGGHDVTVVEAAPRLLARAASSDLSALVARRHAEAGVRLRTDVGVTEIDARDGKVVAVRLNDGSVLPAALVVLGIGVVPNQELAMEAGLPCENGIIVDRQCQTLDPAIFAAGDCTLHPNRFAGGMIRLECVQNAHDQARTAAAVLMGQEASYDTVPWFWSDQFGMKLQTAGLVEGSVRSVPRGAPEGGRGAFYHFGPDGCLKAVETVNMPAEHMLARKLLAAGVSPPADQIADPGHDLRGLLSKPL
ncbi:putative NAD/FAD-dependent oxidoreductase [Gluconacetobacter sacchari DSM 12717]|uniref:FAD-dependent oxidoreductase n=2 Tax=Gluconacetobacter sacchari TaxID=92759 RepID=A0A7W4NPK5_9PROT|nr:FAD-dependent oxidoreductase [Gluconacetobacter sacchari]MBB2161786.1 FAD-dependent oxidoreductase [Gluconacetobacter sacchari]GBQ20135.1 putative NAD/FAD-dependent oxidoreductase [Gluconacetobacter sacchari DSM 12717]